MAIPPAVAACLRQYPLAVSGPARALSESHSGHVWHVETSAGPVVVKEFNARFDEQRVRLAVAAQQHAAANDLAPPILVTATGEQVCAVGGALYTVAAYAGPGYRAPHTAQDAEEYPALGGALGALHRCLDHFAPTESAPDFLEFSPDAQAVLRTLAETAAPGSAKHQALQWRMRVLEQFDGAARETSKQARCWVHGDARVANLVTRPGGALPWLVDFDQVSRFPRGYEITRAFVTLAAPERPGPPPRARWRQYLTSYRASYGSPLPCSETAAMIDTYIAVQAAETRSLTGTDSEVRGIADYRNRRHAGLRWVIAHRDLLAADAACLTSPEQS